MAMDLGYISKYADDKRMLVCVSRLIEQEDHLDLKFAAFFGAQHN